MFSFFKKKPDNRDYLQYLKNEYKSEWKNYRQHLYNPLVKDSRLIDDFKESLD